MARRRGRAPGARGALLRLVLGRWLCPCRGRAARGALRAQVRPGGAAVPWVRVLFRFGFVSPGQKNSQKVFVRDIFFAKKISKKFFSRGRRAAPWIDHFYCALRFFFAVVSGQKKKVFENIFVAFRARKYLENVALFGVWRGARLLLCCAGVTCGRGAVHVRAPWAGRW